MRPRAIERIRTQLDKPTGFLGPWTTSDVEIEMLVAERRVGDDFGLGLNGPLLLSITGAAEQRDISRSLLYELINSGQIEQVRIGRRVLISLEALRGFVKVNSRVGRDSERRYCEED